MVLVIVDENKGQGYESLLDYLETNYPLPTERGRNEKATLMSSTAAAGAMPVCLGAGVGTGAGGGHGVSDAVERRANPGGSVTAIGTGSALLSGSNLGGISISTSGVQPRRSYLTTA